MLAPCGIFVFAVVVVVRSCTCSKEKAQGRLTLPVQIYTHLKALIALFFFVSFCIIKAITTLYTHTRIQTH